MKFFVIQQSDTYEAETKGAYPFVWTPQLASDGTAYAGYSCMKDVHERDILFNVVDGHIVACSIAYTDCFESPRPENFTAYSYTDKGYQINTKLFPLQKPVNLRQYKDRFAKKQNEKSAFDKDGYGGGRLRHLSEEHAHFIIGEILKHYENRNAAFIFGNIYEDICYEAEYTMAEQDAVNSIAEAVAAEERPINPTASMTQATITQNASGTKVPKRDPAVAGRALAYAGFKCEYDNEDRTFKRKNGNPYTEPHHLIPLSKYQDFDRSLDVYENIVSLCSHCHNLLHYGAMEEKEPVLRKLYEDRKYMLAAYGISISYDELKAYYE